MSSVRRDFIFALICGLSIAWIATDFFRNYGLLFFIGLPILSVVGLWLANLIGKRFLFVKQAAKFCLAGGFADVVDIKLFQLLFWLTPFSLTFKAFSFIVSTFIKYWADKYWSFENYNKETIGREIIQFFIVAIVGSILDVAIFYYLTKIKVGISASLWVELSIIIAAIATGLWNFLGYKYIVFKK